MRRRTFIKAVVGSFSAWPIVVRAQQPTPVIGFMHAGVADRFVKPIIAFRKGLSETGFEEGRDVSIEYRWADGHYDRLPGMAADLISRKVAVLVAAPTAATLAAKAATSTIPIVFELGIDPVASGIVASLNRPGGNITGVMNLATALIGKRIEVIHQIVPSSKIIAVLLNPANPTVSNAETSDALASQEPLGIRIEFLKARTIADIEGAFAKAVESKAGAMVISSDPFFFSQNVETSALAARYGIPTINIDRSFVSAGGLISYGGDLDDAYHLTASYVGRILKGEKPADLPVQESTKVELSINLKAAKALGITMPTGLLVRADELIE
jgi:putative ABC transport system substrate-binding protein